MNEHATMAWPEGKRCAVLVSVLFDDGLDAVAVAPDLLQRNKSFSVWKYGAARGVERLCRTFASSGITASWFVPGQVAEEHAGLLKTVAGVGHDLESHGWAFERHDGIPAVQSVELLKRSREAIGQLSGRATTGFRLPAGNWPQGFDQLLLEAGYQWSASLNGDDVPYLHPSRLVEIPVHVELEDRPYFQFNFTPAFPKGQSRIPSYDGVLRNWIAEFDAYRRFGLCYVLQLRPEWSGTPGRISIVEDLLAHIRGFDDVWIATGATIADWHRTNGVAPPPSHPLHVYDTYLQEQQSHG
ncbi:MULTISPECIES: polysaccharide deacetylase family protein [unclassified Ensifer]|uniref:polysaccharide deacetylase family protein n=1 Tax=unclassified Ensifer TaxID=2633371 RepID=UPI000812D36F|nr:MULTISPECIES: polysaccharide deacetylase family protein [unclassified Ensifer]OCP18748.1 chitin deacetylase [Ensifer sp. LC384]OCP19739.1 chitin deacetylase [Ensifer sp. LC54]